MALQDDRLKGTLSLKWFEDGRFEFNLPSDCMVGYAMLHVALDEVQERMLGLKAQHQRKKQLVTVPNDNSAKQPEWGR